MEANSNEKNEKVELKQELLMNVFSPSLFKVDKQVSTKIVGGRKVTKEKMSKVEEKVVKSTNDSCDVIIEELTFVSKEQVINEQKYEIFEFADGKNDENKAKDLNSCGLEDEFSFAEAFNFLKEFNNKKSNWIVDTYIKANVILDKLKKLLGQKEKKDSSLGDILSKLKGKFNEAQLIENIDGIRTAAASLYLLLNKSIEKVDNISLIKTCVYIQDAYTVFYKKIKGVLSSIDTVIDILYEKRSFDDIINSAKILQQYLPSDVLTYLINEIGFKGGDTKKLQLVQKKINNQEIKTTRDLLNFLVTSKLIDEQVASDCRNQAGKYPKEAGSLSEDDCRDCDLLFVTVEICKEIMFNITGKKEGEEEGEEKSYSESYKQNKELCDAYISSLENIDNMIGNKSISGAIKRLVDISEFCAAHLYHESLKQGKLNKKKSDGQSNSDKPGYKYLGEIDYEKIKKFELTDVSTYNVAEKVYLLDEFVKRFSFDSKQLFYKMIDDEIDIAKKELKTLEENEQHAESANIDNNQNDSKNKKNLRDLIKSKESEIKRTEEELQKKISADIEAKQKEFQQYFSLVLIMSNIDKAINLLPTKEKFKKTITVLKLFPELINLIEKKNDIGDKIVETNKEIVTCEKGAKVSNWLSNLIKEDNGIGNKIVETNKEIVTIGNKIVETNKEIATRKEEAEVLDSFSKLIEKKNGIGDKIVATNKEIVTCEKEAEVLDSFSKLIEEMNGIENKIFETNEEIATREMSRIKASHKVYFWLRGKYETTLYRILLIGFLFGLITWIMRELSRDIQRALTALSSLKKTNNVAQEVEKTTNKSIYEKSEIAGNNSCSIPKSNENELNNILNPDDIGNQKNFFEGKLDDAKKALEKLKVEQQNVLKQMNNLYNENEKCFKALNIAKDQLNTLNTLTVDYIKNEKSSVDSKLDNTNEILKKLKVEQQDVLDQMNNLYNENEKCFKALNIGKDQLNKLTVDDITEGKNSVAGKLDNTKEILKELEDGQQDALNQVNKLYDKEQCLQRKFNIEKGQLDTLTVDDITKEKSSVDSKLNDITKTLNELEAKKQDALNQMNSLYNDNKKYLKNIYIHKDELNFDFIQGKIKSWTTSLDKTQEITKKHLDRVKIELNELTSTSQSLEGFDNYIKKFNGFIDMIEREANKDNTDQDSNNIASIKEELTKYKCDLVKIIIEKYKTLDVFSVLVNNQYKDSEPDKLFNSLYQTMSKQDQTIKEQIKDRETEDLQTKLEELQKDREILRNIFNNKEYSKTKSLCEAEIARIVKKERIKELQERIKKLNIPYTIIRALEQQAAILQAYESLFVNLLYKLLKVPEKDRVNLRGKSLNELIVGTDATIQTNYITKDDLQQIKNQQTDEDKEKHGVFNTVLRHSDKLLKEGKIFRYCGYCTDDLQVEGLFFKPNSDVLFNTAFYNDITINVALLFGFDVIIGSEVITSDGNIDLLAMEDATKCGPMNRSSDVKDVRRSFCNLKYKHNFMKNKKKEFQALWDSTSELAFLDILMMQCDRHTENYFCSESSNVGIDNDCFAIKDSVYETCYKRDFTEIDKIRAQTKNTKYENDIAAMAQAKMPIISKALEKKISSVDDDLLEKQLGFLFINECDEQKLNACVKRFQILKKLISGGTIKVCEEIDKDIVSKIKFHNIVALVELLLITNKRFGDDGSIRTYDKYLYMNHFLYIIGEYAPCWDTYIEEISDHKKSLEFFLNAKQSKYPNEFLLEENERLYIKILLFALEKIEKMSPNEESVLTEKLQEEIKKKVAEEKVNQQNKINNDIKNKPKLSREDESLEVKRNIT